MKNEWTNFVTGYVKVQASGRGTERLLNALLRERVHIWEVRRTADDTVTFRMDSREIRVLRACVRKAECKVRFLSGHGGPFFLKRMLKNSGFLAGIIAFLLCIFVLSNMVWGIEFHDADPAVEYEIRKELDRMGVEIGRLQFLVDSPDVIQRKLNDRIERLTWIGVELKGTTYHFRAVVKKQPEEIKKTGPQHLIAKKKAVIADMLVEKGQPKVKVHDFVKKGQLLVSGKIGREESPEIVAAKGKVFGETWYKANVKVPLKTTFSVFNGDEKTAHYLNVFGLKALVWGWGDPGYSDYEKEVQIKPFRFLQWELPFSYETATLRSRETAVRTYTKEQAIHEAKEMAKDDLKKQLDHDALIKEEKILRESMENGKVILSIHYQVIENIAEGLPIIQGD